MASRGALDTTDQLKSKEVNVTRLIGYSRIFQFSTRRSYSHIGMLREMEKKMMILILLGNTIVLIRFRIKRRYAKLIVRLFV